MANSSERNDIIFHDHAFLFRLSSFVLASGYGGNLKTKGMPRRLLATVTQFYDLFEEEDQEENVYTA